MKPDYGACDLCKKGKLELIEKKNIAGSDYLILKCGKCSHQKAKRAE